MDPTINDDASWARECTSALEACVALGSVAGATEWARRRSAIPPEKHLRIWDSDFTGKDLSGFDFTYCKFRNVRLLSANLKKVSFLKAIVRQSDLTGADLRGGTLEGADFRTSVMRDMLIDDSTNLALISGGLPDHMDGLLRDRAEAARRRLEFARDRSRSGWHKSIVAAIGYGESVKRLVAAALVVLTGFAVLFRFADSKNTGSAEAAIYSLQYFVALSDPYAERSFFLSAAGTVEAVCGLVFLALLLSALARHLVVSR